MRRYLRHSKEEPALPMLTSACPGERPGPASRTRGTTSHESALGAGAQMGEVRGHGPSALGVLDLEGVQCRWGPPQVHPSPHLTQPLPGAHRPPPLPVRPDTCCSRGLEPLSLFKCRFGASRMFLLNDDALSLGSSLYPSVSEL